MLETLECHKSTLISGGLVVFCSKLFLKELLMSQEHSASVENHAKSPRLVAAKRGVAPHFYMCLRPRPWRAWHCADAHSLLKLLQWLPLLLSLQAIHSLAPLSLEPLFPLPPYSPHLPPPPCRSSCQAVYLSLDPEWSLYTEIFNFASALNTFHLFLFHLYTPHDTAQKLALL